MLTFVLVALATHRLTLLVVKDELAAGPRERLQRRFESAKQRRTGTVTADEWQSKISYLLGCPWCASIWVGGAVVAVTALTVGCPLPVLAWLAASSATGVLAELTDG